MTLAGNLMSILKWELRAISCQGAYYPWVGLSIKAVVPDTPNIVVSHAFHGSLAKSCGGQAELKLPVDDEAGPSRCQDEGGSKQVDGEPSVSPALGGRDTKRFRIRGRSYASS
jgi:hypothetical protein